MKRFFPATLLLLVCLSTLAFSQSSNAVLGGSVEDATGALIPGVTVTATNTATGIVTTIVTNETGSYQFPALQPGSYTVAAALPGFQTQTYSGVTLGISQTVRLNFKLAIAGVATGIDVTVPADTLIASTSASVGNVLPEYKVNDLPMANRNVLDLVNITAGTRGGSFAGLPSSMTMTTRDGIAVNHGRYALDQAFSTTYLTPDLIDEVRVIVSPADAETGRGSGQVQVSTRSGTNNFHGAVFWSNRNSVWDSNTMANNFNNVGTDYQNRNQYGGRLGGPIIKNKTFFFFLFEGQRSVTKSQVVTTVLTDTARQGLYRYFPGVQSANATALTPTVDLQGNPVRPASATGDLRTFNLYNYDPLRPGPDPSGFVGRIIAAMPPANDFKFGDGLNTAGHRWLRRVNGASNLFGTSDLLNRDQYNVRLDHQINANHKVNAAMTREKNWADSGLVNWPNGFNGMDTARPQVYTASLVSTLSSSLLNEFRFGLRRGNLDSLQAYDVPGERGEEARKWLGFVPGPGGPVSPAGTPYILEGTIAFTSNYLINDWNGSIGNVNPLYTYADTISWTRGKHAFKGGAELRRGNGNAWNSDEIIPNIHLGFPGAPSGGRDYYCDTCGLPVTGIDNTNPTLPGLNSNDAARARQILTDLAGSVANVSQAFSLKPDPTHITWLDYPNYYKKYRDFHQNEFSAFFKDDWKFTPDLTLNLGLRWEWYGVPYEASGMMATPVGGSEGAFGLTGDWNHWYQPGERGPLTTFEFVGKNSAQPNKQLYKDDWNNFGPAVGLSWHLPWFQRETVLRAGYGIAYQGLFAGGGALGLDIGVGLAPSLNHFASHVTTTATDLDLRNLVLPIPERHPDGAIPVVPVTERSQSLTAYDSNTVIPYVQNFNVELQRELARNLTLEVRYIGNKATKLSSNININSRIIEENGFLNAFRITREGGNAPLFDQMLNGLNFGTGIGTVNGTTRTGSSALRLYPSTRSFLANADPAGLADFLNRTANLTGEVGGIPRNGGLPENFFVANPQFNNVNIQGNANNSTYHSLEVGVTKRMSNGFTSQTTYTWSRTIGTIGNIDPRDRSLNKALLTMHRTHDIRSNGLWQLPFGPGHRLLGNASSWVNHLVADWQLGGIMSWNSGQPLTLTAGSNPFGGTSQFPDMVVALPKSFGEVTKLNTPGVVTYFPGYKQTTDPDVSNITTVDSLQSRNTRQAITDEQGNFVLVNPKLGAIGNMGQAWIEGPSQFDFDANLTKRLQVAEGKSLQLRIDAINVLNHPNWGNPTLSINSPNFGRISLPNSGNREFTFSARLDF